MSDSVLDPAIEPDLAYLGGVADGEMEIASRSLDDQTWVVVYQLDDASTPRGIHDIRPPYILSIHYERA